MTNLIAGYTNICNYPDIDSLMADYKTMWVGSIVFLAKREHFQFSDFNRLMCSKWFCQMLNKSGPVFSGIRSNIYSNIVFVRQYRYAFNMIRMFVRNKNGFHLFYIQLLQFHSDLNLPAGKASIYQNGFCFIADIIAIAIASGVE